MARQKAPRKRFDAPHNPSTHINKPPPTLLTLPLELRLHIYEDLFQGTTLHTLASATESSSRKAKLSKSAIAILRVCKQTHAEALPIFYSATHFHDALVHRYEPFFNLPDNRKGAKRFPKAPARKPIWDHPSFPLMRQVSIRAVFQPSSASDIQLIADNFTVWLFGEYLNVAIHAVPELLNSMGEVASVQGRHPRTVEFKQAKPPGEDKTYETFYKHWKWYVSDSVEKYFVSEDWWAVWTAWRRYGQPHLVFETCGGGGGDDDENELVIFGVMEDESRTRLDPVPAVRAGTEVEDVG